jgi:hypothetical protein
MHDKKFLRLTDFRRELSLVAAKAVSKLGDGHRQAAKRRAWAKHENERREAASRALWAANVSNLPTVIFVLLFYRFLFTSTLFSLLYIQTYPIFCK